MNTILEANVFVNKVISYEKANFSDLGYAMNHLAISAYMVRNENILSKISKGNINECLFKFPQLKKWFLFDHYNCNCSEHDDFELFNTGEELNREHFLSAMNGHNPEIGNIHIVYHDDHSEPRAMGTSSIDKGEYITIADVDNLQNGNHQQIIISNGCSTTEFEKDCIAEHFINNEHGGAVAFIGFANIGYVSTFPSLYSKFLENLYSNGQHAIGSLFVTMVYDKLTSDYYQFKKIIPEPLRLHLLGDPEMQVWSETPKNFEVNTFIPGMETNIFQMKLSISNLPENECANICFMKDNECYQRATVFGNTPFNFVYSPKIDGDMVVTITAPNYKPYQMIVPIHSDLEGRVSIDTIVGFDGHVNIGDSASFKIALRNSGQGDITNAVATLTSSSPYISIHDGKVEYNEIKNNEIKLGSSNFKIVVDKNASEIKRNEWNAACFYLSVTCTYSTGATLEFTDTFRIDITSPKLRISSIRIVKTSDGDNVPEPGETVVLSLNSVRLGSRTKSKSWKAETYSSYIEDINIVNDSCYIKLTNNYETESAALIRFRLMSGSIEQDNILTDIGRELPEMEYTTIHYKLSEKTVTIFWDKKPAHWRFNIYRSDSEEGHYVKLNQVPLSFCYFEDDSIDPNKVYYYRVSAHGSRGIEGPLSSPIKVMPVFSLMIRNAPGNLYRHNDEAYTADFDFDGQKEIVQVGTMINGSEISSLLTVIRPDGTEPYDIDGNVATISGYAKFPYDTEATPTVADLYGNGEPSIITLARSTAEDGKYYATCFSSLDKDNDNLPDLLWKTDMGGAHYRNAVVTDIDRPDGLGRKEVVTLEENNKGITIFNADGSVKRKFGAGIITGNYSTLAVADLDNDGYKEIICGAYGGLYVWRHDGSAFAKQPLFARSGCDLRSSPIVADLDGDGIKEIIIGEREGTITAPIYAIRPDGTCLKGFDGSEGAASIPYPNKYNSEGLDHAVSVADINGDGHLYVFSLGQGCVRVWSNTGDVILDLSLPDLFKSKEWNAHRSLPLVADIDGDSKPDIVFSDQNVIYAIHADGTNVAGYPMTVPSVINHGISIADIDNDGKNEIIAADAESNINAWKTFGRGVAWGRARFDSGNTGEYVEGGSDPIVVTADRTWGNEPVNNDIIVRSGTLTFPHGEYQIRPGCKIIVMDGGTLNVYGGVLLDANILVKSGGSMVIDNNGVIYLEDHGDVKLESGASFDFITGDIFPLDWWE